MVLANPDPLGINPQFVRSVLDVAELRAFPAVGLYVGHRIDVDYQTTEGVRRDQWQRAVDRYLGHHLGHAHAYDWVRQWQCDQPLRSLLMKIAVYAILKDEAPNAKAWFRSALGADYIVPVDTGSTDGGDSILEDALDRAIPHISVLPWRFDDARMQHYLGRELMYREQWREAITYFEAYLRGPALFPLERSQTATYLAACWSRI